MYHPNSNKGLSYRPRRVLLAVTLTMYASAAIHWAFSLQPLLTASASRRATISTVIASCTSPVLADCPKLTASRIGFGVAHMGADPFAWGGVEVSLVVLNFLLSDAVVLWRAWILWERSLPIKMFSLMLYFSTLGMSVAHIYIPLHERSMDKLIEGDLFVLDQWGLATLVLSLVTNVWATFLIALKCWHHRREIRNFLEGAASTTSFVERVCLLLIETGIFYVAVWVFYLYASIAAHSGASNVFIDLMIYGLIQLVGIYPTIIIILVSLGQTRAEHDLLHRGAPSLAPPDDGAIKLDERRGACFSSAVRRIAVTIEAHHMDTLRVPGIVGGHRPSLDDGDEGGEDMLPSHKPSLA